jgi:hypothetical protein
VEQVLLIKVLQQSEIKVEQLVGEPISVGLLATVFFTSLNRGSPAGLSGTISRAACSSSRASSSLQASTILFTARFDMACLLWRGRFQSQQSLREVEHVLLSDVLQQSLSEVEQLVGEDKEV